MSESIVLPKNLTTESEIGKEKVPVDMVVQGEFTPEDVDRIGKELGHFHVTGKNLANMRDLGLSVEQLGFLRTMKGGMVMSGTAILALIGKCGEMVENTDTKMPDKLKAMALAATLTNCFTRMVGTAVRNERDVAEVVLQRDEQKRNTFKSGMAAPINV